MEYTRKAKDSRSQQNYVCTESFPVPPEVLRPLPCELRALAEMFSSRARREFPSQTSLLVLQSVVHDMPTLTACEGLRESCVSDRWL